MQHSPASPVHVIGASGRSGAALCRTLMNTGFLPIPVVRDPAKFAATGLPQTALIADLADPAALARALAGARQIVSTAHARHAHAILTAAPSGASFVFLGSTRRYTRWPDAHAAGVLQGESAFLASGRTGVMLHPTMIYGAEGEDNVRRLATLLRRLPIVPLPQGGRALVQPIYQDDVTRCILAALRHDWTGPNSLVIAGPTALPYADFVRAIASAANLPRPRIVSLPAWALMAATPLTALPALPRIHRDEIRRLLEDKAFPITAMTEMLAVHPIPLAQGLAAMFDFV